MNCQWDLSDFVFVCVPKCDIVKSLQTASRIVLPCCRNKKIRSRDYYYTLVISSEEDEEKRTPLERFTQNVFKVEFTELMYKLSQDELMSFLKNTECNSLLTPRRTSFVVHVHDAYTWGVPMNEHTIVTLMKINRDQQIEKKISHHKWYFDAYLSALYKICDRGIQDIDLSLNDDLRLPRENEVHMHVMNLRNVFVRLKNKSTDVDANKCNKESMSELMFVGTNKKIYSLSDVQSLWGCLDDVIDELKTKKKKIMKNEQMNMYYGNEYDVGLTFLRTVRDELKYTSKFPDLRSALCIVKSIAAEMIRAWSMKAPRMHVWWKTDIHTMDNILQMCYSTPTSLGIDPGRRR